MSDDIAEIRSDVRELRQRAVVLTGAVGIIAALVIAMLGNTLTMSYQLGQTIGRLDLLIGHVSLK